MPVCKHADSGNVLEFPCQKKTLGYSEDKLETQVNPSTSSTLNQQGAVLQGLNTAADLGAWNRVRQKPKARWGDRPGIESSQGVRSRWGQRQCWRQATCMLERGVSTM